MWIIECQLTRDCLFRNFSFRTRRNIATFEAVSVPVDRRLIRLAGVDPAGPTLTVASVGHFIEFDKHTEFLLIWKNTRKKL